MIDVRYHEAAESELYDALGFLELRTKGLGRRLLNEVRRTAARIAEFPSLGTEIRPRVRKIPVRTFRYSLVLARLRRRWRQRADLGGGPRQPSAGLLLERENGVLVQKDTHFLKLARYVVLNPVRAGRVRSAGDYPWSSCRATAGEDSAPAWLETRATLAAFADTEPEAVVRYRRFVAEGKGQPSPWDPLKQHLVAPLKDVPHPLVDPVEALGVNAVELPHALGEIAVRGLDDEMVVVGHQTVGVDRPVEPRLHPGEHLEKDPRVSRSQIDVLPCVPARGDVVEGAGELQSQ